MKQQFDIDNWRQPTAPSGTHVDEISEIASAITSRGIDITQGYTVWRDLAFALADGLGEQGRTIFHQLSSINASYNHSECDKQYTACLRSHNGGITIKTFYKMAKDTGVDIAEITKKWKKEQRTMNGNDEKNGKTPPTSPLRHVNTENKKIEKCSIYGDSYFQMNIGEVANLANLTKTESVSNLETNSANSFSSSLKKEDIPYFLYPIWENYDKPIDRDKMMLGVLNVVSGLIPDTLYSLYDSRKVFCSLYNIVYGKPATSKGDLQAVVQIAEPLKRRMRRQYEAEKEQYDKDMADWESKPRRERGPEPRQPLFRSPLLPANSSSSAVYRAMDANGGWGMMFETEADTLTNMLSKNEYGDYSDLLRKAHHHETISMQRVTEHINIDIEKPRLAVFLTCTGSQLPLLLPPSGIANGLASRFLFYALPDTKVEFRNVFARNDSPIDEVYLKMGEELMTLIDELNRRSQHPIQFALSTAQQQLFMTHFSALLSEQSAMMGGGFNSFIYRIALECYRYTMILSALRRLSTRKNQPTLFDPNEQTLLCEDTDLQTAITIVECLVNHTARVYAVLGDKDNDPFSKIDGNVSQQLKDYYHALPEGREFMHYEAMEAADKLGINHRTARRFLGELLSKYQLLDRPLRGVYIKKTLSNSDNRE